MNLTELISPETLYEAFQGKGPCAPKPHSIEREQEKTRLAPLLLLIQGVHANLETVGENFDVATAMAILHSVDLAIRNATEVAPEQ